jgi:transposase
VLYTCSVATEGITSVATPEDELGQLRAEVATLRPLRVENELLRAARQQWQQEQIQHERAIELQRQTLAEQACTIDHLQHQLQSLLRRVYGRSSEKLNPNQMQLFETLLDNLAPKTFVEPEPTAASTDELPSNAVQPVKKGHGRRRLPADLPRTKVLHDLPEEQKPCPCCGKLRHVIGQQISEQLDYVPARLNVIQHVQLTYACRHCEQQASEEGPQIETASKPLSPIEKGLAAPGLLSYVIVSKYGDHLPLYRLENILKRHEVEIARSTMCGWMAQCATLLRPLQEVMTMEVLTSKVIHTDDTPVEVLQPGRGETRTGRFWVYVGDAHHPFTVFTYTPSRSRDGPREFLKNWSGFLQADAFGGYDGIYAGQVGGAVTEVACWAHARRKFYEARTSDAALSTQALAYIRLLYDVEDEAKRQFLLAARDADESPMEDARESRSENAAMPNAPQTLNTAASNGPHSAASQSQHRPASQSQDNPASPLSLAAIRLALRREKSAPRLEQFGQWLRAQQAGQGGSVLPKSPLGQAITYALNQWTALNVYTTDGNLAIDNNASENALRRVALGRKNWLFCGSDNGGHTAAVLFSLIATCQRHKVEPLAYFRNLLTKIASHPISRLTELLPQSIATT